MLRDEVAKYTELTGEDGAYVPIIKLGAFLGGYERGLEEVNKVLDKIRAEIEPKCDRINTLASELSYPEHREIQELLCEIMDLCKAEGSEKE